MKTIIVLAALTAVCSAVHWTDLRVKWARKDAPRDNSYFKIPRTASSAIAEGWVLAKGVNDHPVDVFCLPNDGRFCIITDSYGNIAGFQFGVLASDIENKGMPYDLSTISQYKRKIVLGEAYWTVTVYTVDPSVIDAGGRSDAQGLTGTTGVWIEEGDGYMAVSRKEKSMQRALDYRMQSCIPTMGLHYYYAMDEKLACTEFQPVFLLYQDGDLLGLGIQGFGTMSSTKRVWYEPIVPSLTKLVAPNSPDCFTEWAENYNVISMHVYFVEEPWNITCDNWFVRVLKKIVHIF